MINKIYSSMGAVIGFLVIEIIISVILGEKVAQNMALLILVGMLLINSDSIIGFLDNFK